MVGKTGCQIRLLTILKLGAATETELKGKKAHVEDAMHATKAWRPSS